MKNPEASLKQAGGWTPGFQSIYKKDDEEETGQDGNIDLKKNTKKNTKKNHERKQSN
jgi:hypothetical protein